MKHKVKTIPFVGVEIKIIAENKRELEFILGLLGASDEKRAEQINEVKDKDVGAFTAKEVSDLMPFKFWGKIYEEYHKALKSNDDTNPDYIKGSFEE